MVETCTTLIQQLRPHLHPRQCPYLLYSMGWIYTEAEIRLWGQPELGSLNFQVSLQSNNIFCDLQTRGKLT